MAPNARFRAALDLGFAIIFDFGIPIFDFETYAAPGRSSGMFLMAVTTKISALTGLWKSGSTVQLNSLRKKGSNQGH